MPTRLDRAEAPVYPDDLLPKLQQTLATLADLQLRYEIERDYLEDCRQRNPDFSLKGRTLASLRRQMHEWHRDLEAIARIEAARRRAEAARARAHGGASGREASGGGSWPGAAVKDWSWTRGPRIGASARSIWWSS